MNRSRPGRQFLLLAVSSALSVVLLEFGVRWLTPFPIHGTRANRIPHESLGYTLDPRSRGVDAYGFRNPEGASRRQVAAIGDSHTQGFNVRSEASWPARLAALSGLNVYNYGVGGYGIYQYYYLTEMALEEGASTVILAFYPANDLDHPSACNSLGNRYFVDLLAQQELAAPPCTGTQAANRLLRLDRERGVAYWLTARFGTASAIKYLADLYRTEEEYVLGSSQRILRARAAVSEQTTDLEDPWVRLHYSNSRRLFRLLRDSASRRGSRLGVILLPSKARILSKWARRHGQPLPIGFGASNERRLIRAYEELFSELGIPHADATARVSDAFERQAEKGRIFYPRKNGHPTETGYEAYAEAALELIRSMEANP